MPWLRLFKTNNPNAHRESEILVHWLKKKGYKRLSFYEKVKGQFGDSRSFRELLRLNPDLLEKFQDLIEKLVLLKKSMAMTETKVLEDVNRTIKRQPKIDFYIRSLGTYFLDISRNINALEGIETKFSIEFEGNIKNTLVSINFGFKPGER